MRIVVLFILVAVTLSSSNLITISVECPQQQVADVNRICIRPDFIEGCLIYKNANECDTCGKDYEPVNGRCDVIDSSAINPVVLVGCLREVDGKCYNCANGYLRKGDSCIKGIKECQQYSQKGQCLLCNEEYSLMFGECKHNILLGCKHELPDHRCSECFPPFELNSYTCVIKNCKKYNDFGCYACECGYHISEARSCKQYEDGCLKYYRGICSECMPHFKLMGGNCMIDGCLKHQNHGCSSCKEDYDLVNGTCQFKNCFDWFNDSCLICKKGYNLVEGKCRQEKEKFVCSG